MFTRSDFPGGRKSERRATRALGLLTGLAAAAAFAASAAAAPERGPDVDETTGFVAAMTNAPAGNEVVLYDRALNGALRLVGRFATGGLGDPQTRDVGFFDPVDALGAQNPIIVALGRCVIGVNAGSDTIFSGRIRKDGRGDRTEFDLVDVVGSGGQFPASLTAHGNLLYVLNSGGAGNVTGFSVKPGCQLLPLEGTTRSLEFEPEELRASPPFFLISPAQVAFSPGGEWLVVTVKGAAVDGRENPQTNAIHVFSIDDEGRPGDRPVTSTSSGFTPFGIGFARSFLVVAEAFGTAGSPPPPPTAGAGAVSSYAISDDGFLELVSPSVGNGQTATCWIATSAGGRFAYVTNNASSTISGYRLRAGGELALLDDDGVTAKTGANPVDLALSRGGRFLYTLNAGAGTISAFLVDQRTGALELVQEIEGLPVDDGAVGMAVR